MFLLNLIATITGYILWGSLFFVMVLMMIETGIKQRRRKKTLKKMQRDFERATGLMTHGVEVLPGGGAMLKVDIHADASQFTTQVEKIKHDIEDAGLTLFDIEENDSGTEITVNPYNEWKQP